MSQPTPGDDGNTSTPSVSESPSTTTTTTNQKSNLLDPSQTFSSLCKSLNLDPRLSKAIHRLKYTHPTLIQSRSLPLSISAGRDILLRARTGSGKTLAYTLPVLQKIVSSSSSSSSSSQQSSSSHTLKAVILVPTRELCSQVHGVVRDLTYYLSEEVSFVSLAGHNDKKERAAQEATLRDGPDGVVATPGGLLSHVREGGLDLSGVESLVVDEADLVLSFGYESDINEILKCLPKIYQGFLMSATLSPGVETLKKIVLHSPAVLKLEEDDDVSNKNAAGALSQFYLMLPPKDKQLVIYVFLKLGLLRGKGLFFVNTTNNAYRIKLFLEQFHINSAVLNAELPIKSRMSIIEQFNIGNFDYLIATDESTHSHSKKKDDEYGVSRGLDFRGVSFVVNIDFPLTAENYTHRIGRTARGGAKGVALSLLSSTSPSESSLLSTIQSLHTPSGAAMPQPSPLDFDLTEIEGFRYRVEDVSRAVTKVAVQETRAAELKAEILNSELLERHFDDRPEDRSGLMHVRKAVHVGKVHDHLKHVAPYLLPRGMQVVEPKKKKRKRVRVRKVAGNRGGERRLDNDPLQSFEGEQKNLDDFLEEEEHDGDGHGDEDEEEEMDTDDKKKQKEAKVFLQSDSRLGKSTAGRNKWKEQHKRGKFSRRYKKKQEF